MTKNDLVNKVYKKYKKIKDLKLTEEKTNEIIDFIIDELEIGLKKDKEISLPKFGKIYVLEQKERRGTHPQTTQWITIPPKKVIKFRASSILKAKINNEQIPKLPTDKTKPKVAKTTTTKKTTPKKPSSVKKSSTTTKKK